MSDDPNAAPSALPEYVHCTAAHATGGSTEPPNRTGKQNRKRSIYAADFRAFESLLKPEVGFRQSV